MPTTLHLEPELVATPVLRPRAGVAVASVGVSVPDTVVTNAEIGARLGVDDDWIVRRTGIHSRRVAARRRAPRHPRHRVRACRAGPGRRPIRSDVDLVIVATTTSDELMPGTAPLVAHALGATGAGAFDVGSACTGFLSALAVGAGPDRGRPRALRGGHRRRLHVADHRPRRSRHRRGVRRRRRRGRARADRAARDGSARSCSAPTAPARDHIQAERADGKIRMRGHETFREAVARLTLCTHQAVRGRGRRPRRDRPVRLPPGQRPDPLRRGRAARPAARPRGRLHRRVRQHVGGDAAAGAGLQRAGRDCCRQATGCCSARSVPGFTWGATVIEWGRP